MQGPQGQDLRRWRSEDRDLHCPVMSASPQTHGIMLTFLYDAKKPPATLGSTAIQDHHPYMQPIIDLNIIMTHMAVCSQLTK